MLIRITLMRLVINNRAHLHHRYIVSVFDPHHRIVAASTLWRPPLPLWPSPLPPPSPSSLSSPPSPSFGAWKQNLLLGHLIQLNDVSFCCCDHSSIPPKVHAYRVVDSKGTEVVLIPPTFTITPCSPWSWIVENWDKTRVILAQNYLESQRFWSFGD